MARSPSPHPSPLRGEGVACGSLGANRDTQFADRPRIVTGARIGRVMLWMSGVLLSFSVMAVSIRALARTFNVFEILALRNAAGLAILLALACARPALRASLLPRRMGMHALSNSVHFAAQYAWALSITLLPLATVFALEFTNPAWLALFATWLLGERMTPSRTGAIALGFLGALVILRPGLQSFQPAALIMLAAALGFALAAIA